MSELIVSSLGAEITELLFNRTDKAEALNSEPV
jgi:hypothetical protein